MGLFNKKTIIQVSTQQVRMTDDAEDLDKKAIITSVLSGTPLAQGLTQARLHGMYAMTERYYQYGKQIFTNGLPEGTQSSVIVKSMDVLSALKEEFPNETRIKVIEASIDSANPYYFVYPILYNKYGYELSTGLVNKPPAEMGGGVILVDVSAEGAGLIRITFLSPDSQEEVEVVEVVEGFIPDDMFLHAVFTTKDIEGEQTWNYKIGEGTYPELDGLKEYDDTSPYYPIVPIRSDNKDMTKDKSTDLFRTSKYLLKKLTLSIEDIAEGVNGNENIESIDHVFFSVRVDIRNDTAIVTEYLAKYFYFLYQSNPSSEDLYKTWEDTDDKSKPPPYTRIVIQDGQSRQSINYLYITTSVRTGKLDNPVVEFQEEVRKLISSNNKGWSSFEYEQSYVTYQYQESNDVIRTVTVFGLMTIEYVNGKETIDINITDSGNFDGTTKMMIPIHRGIVKTLKLGDRNKLFHSAMYLTIQTYDKRKEKWYETGVFKDIFTIVGIILIVMSAGQASPAVLAAYGAIWGVVVHLIIQLVIGAVIGIIAKHVAMILIEQFGADWAKWIIAALVVYSFVVGMGKDAGKLLAMLSNGMVKAYSESIGELMEDIRKAIDKIMAEAAEFSHDVNKFLEELIGEVLTIDLAAILEESHRIEPIYLAQESAEQYYDRIDASRHMNEIQLSIPSVFHTKKLTPPTLDETLKEFERG